MIPIWICFYIKLFAVTRWDIEGEIFKKIILRSLWNWNTIDVYIYTFIVIHLVLLGYLMVGSKYSFHLEYKKTNLLFKEVQANMYMKICSTPLTIKNVVSEPQ